MLEKVIKDVLAGLQPHKATLYTANEGHFLPARIKEFPPGHLFHFEGKDAKIKWSYIGGETHAEDDHLSKASLKLESKEMTPRNMETVRHDMVTELLFQGKDIDVPLSRICRLNQPSDNLTPDMIYDMSSCFCVVEVGTTASPAAQSARLTFEEKLNKYSGYLKTMAIQCRKPIVYIVIAVNVNGVYSNIDMPIELVEQILYRFQLGLRFEREYAASGLRSQVDMHEKPEIINLRSAFERFTDEGTSVDSFGFDRSTFEEWSTYQADARYLSQGETTILQSTKEWFDEMRSKPLLEQISGALMDIEKEMIDKGGVRVDSKCPIQVPLIIPEVKEGSEPCVAEIPSSNETAIYELWNLAISSATSKLEKFKDNDIEDEVMEAMGEKEVERNPREFHRVQLNDLSKAAQAFFAFDGWHAKKYKNTDFLRERRAFSQQSFSPATSTRDIDETVEFIPDYCAMDQYFPNWKTAMNLLKYANELQGNSNVGLEQVQDLCNTDLFVALWTISTLAAELSVSQRQNCKHLEMIYKRLNGLKYELLICPTNSNSHIFFVVRVKGRLLLGEDNKTFRDMSYLDGWYYSQMLSVNSSRLENLIKAPTTWLNSFIHWRIWTDKCSKDEIGDLVIQPTKASRLAMMTLMMSLEDKSTTEELVTAVRYISMNFFKGDDMHSPPELTGPISKLPTVLRSRLAVYFYKRIKEYCYLQARSLPKFNFKNMKDLSEERNGDDWQDLICPLINVPVSQCQTVIQVFYMGYAKNKEVESYENADFSLIKKILDNFRNKDPEKADLYTGAEEPTPEAVPGPHEFSKNFLKDACDQAKLRIIGIMGTQYKQKLMDQVLKELVERGNYEALATLKASYNFDIEVAKELEMLKDKEEKVTRVIEHELNGDLSRLLDIAKQGTYYLMKPQDRIIINQRISELRKKLKLLSKIHGKAKNSKSCKCHEAVILAMEDLNTDGCVPLVAISQIYRSLTTTWGGVCCYLFKKNQHGGLREIYVLTFYSRLVQLLVESAGRVLCSMFHEEVMTHPTEKIDAVHRHFHEVKKREVNHDVSSLTRCSSEDKSKWSQNNNVAAYAFIAAQMFPKTLAVPIMKILKLWKTKKILLPSGVQSMLEEDTPKDDEAYEQLRDEFWGRKELELLDRVGGSYITIDTGMWQGILHFFSSFQHVLQVLHYNKYIKTRMMPVMKEVGIVDYHLTSLVSSDDSLTMLTVFFDDKVLLRKEDTAMVDRVLALTLMTEKAHSAFFMMIESVKSCFASTTVFEFNSIFHIGQGSISPAIKKVLCCTNIIQSESFETKGRVMYNSIKDIVEEGCSNYQVHLHQLISGLLHYQAIGMTTTQLFPVWARELLGGQPDPNLGFYLVDKDIICGVMGYDYMKYESLKTTDVPLLPSSPKLIQLNLSGTFRNAVLFLHGSRRRWNRLKERVLIPGWEEEVEQNPEVLFKAFSETKHEARIRLCMKACTKGVYEALSNGGRLASILATSVFIMRDRVMTIRSTDYEDKDGISEKNTEKVSLLKLASEQRKAGRSTNIISHSTMLPEHKDLFYPNHEMFKKVTQTVEVVRRHGVERECIAFRKCRNHVVLRTIKANSRVSLMVCCRKQWFNMKVRPNKTAIEESWRYYKGQFHWLKDTLEETMSTNFFEKVTDLYRFLQSSQDTSSVLHILCRRLGASQSIGKINEIMLYNQYPGLKIVMGREGKEEIKRVTDESPGHSKEFQSMLNLALLHPDPYSKKEPILRDIIERHNFKFNNRSLIGLNPVESRQLILLAHLSGASSNEVLSLLRMSGGQMLKYFTIEQTHHEGRYTKYGCLTISHKSFTAEVHVWDDFVIHISTTNLMEMKLSWDSVMDELEDVGIRINPMVTPRLVKQKALKQKPSLASHFQLLDDHSSGYWAMEHGLADKYSGSSGVKYPEITVLSPNDLIGETDSLDLFVKEVGENVIAMIAESPNGQFTTLCKFYPLRSTGPSEALMDLWRGEINGDNDLECWLMNQPRSLQSLVEELISLKFAYDSSASEAQMRKINFHREGLAKRLLYKGYLTPSRVLGDVPETIEIDQAVVTEQEILDAQALQDEMNLIVEKESLKFVAELPTRSRVGQWIDSQRKEIAQEMSSTRSVSNIENLEQRVNEVICPPVQMEGALTFAFLLHTYWDNLIEELKDRGIIDAFSKPRILAESEEYTCRLIEWILNRDCLAEFKKPLFYKGQPLTSSDSDQTQY